MNKNYAYLTEGTDCTIMHLHNQKKTAEESKEIGKVVETNIQDENGHALAFYEGKQQAIIVYSDTLMKTEATGKAIKDADKLFPQLAELYRRCKG